MRALAALLVPALLAAVEGTVINGTSGKPQSGVDVALLKLTESGMQPAARATTGADGKFAFPQEEPAPYLLHTLFQGVTYSLMLNAGDPAGNLRLEVYEASAKAGLVVISQRVALLEPSAEALSVTDSFFFKNGGKLTYFDTANGTLRFFLPAKASQPVSVSAQGVAGVPLQLKAEKAGAGGLHKVVFPIRPGETRIDVSYRLPAEGVFESRNAYQNLTTRLVVPQGVKLEGEGLESLGQEPSTGALLYAVKGSPFKVTLSGTGSLRQGSSGEEDEGPGIQQILPRVYDRLAWVLTLSFLILALGFLLLYRRRAPR